MKKIIAIVLILLLLVAGGLGGSAVLGYGPLAPLFKTNLKKAEEPPPVPEAPKSKMLDLGSFYIPIITGHDIRRQMGIDLQMDVANEKVELATASMPRLISAVRIELFDLIPAHSDAKSKADRQFIREQLRRELSEMLGEGAVREVVIKGMYER